MTPHESALARTWAVLRKWGRFLKGSLHAMARRCFPAARYDEAAQEGLRASFREACAWFKRLVSANNKALEAMSHMEETLAGSSPYDLAYVRTQTTRIASSVYQMIEAMDALAPDRYSVLRERFEEIRAQLAPLLETAPDLGEGPLVRSFAELAAVDAPEVGGKAANLGELRNRAYLPVPDGFAVTARAFWLFMRHSGLNEEVDRLLRLADPDRLDSLYGVCSRIQQKVVSAPLPEELETALTAAANALMQRTGWSGSLAVRSSALGEDMPGHAFAGQYRSLLNVPPEHVAEAWREVIASKYGAEAVAYRMRCGLSDRDTAVSVAVMPMLGSVAGGVLYTRNPVQGNSDTMVIHAASGLPRGVVDGRVPTDRFVLSCDPPYAIVERHIARKTERYEVGNGEGVTRRETPAHLVETPSLDDEKLRALATLSMRVEAHYGCAQDVEWALLPHGEFMLLQARPLSLIGGDPVACVFPGGQDASEMPDGARDNPLHGNYPLRVGRFSDEVDEDAGSAAEAGAGGSSALQTAGAAEPAAPYAAGTADASDVAFLDANNADIMIDTTCITATDGAASAGVAAGSGDAGAPPAEYTVLLRGGETAAPGAGAGEVVHVRKQVEALAFPKGAVLVLSHAAPRWAPLLSRAAAVVAGTGSSAGHLANVSREFGVPALFGIGDAVEALPAGATVTVDADGGRVIEGTASALLRRAKRPRVVMRGSSVHTTLEKVLEHIAPLTLTDPDGPDFRAANCRTLHDITRFCHQKSVEEMFRDGKGARYPQHLARRLYHGRPLQFWVVDLDDAFRDPPEGKLIPLQNIVSPPMRALWHGMMDIPWEGPPPVHASGFLSVLAQSALDPGFEPAGASVYAMRNYFLVSSRFCTLQSRFGYHFCTVETLAGDEDAENFAAFRFKGGAADLDRRLRRVLLIADVLEEHGFRVRVIRDSLAARLEGFPLEMMLRALRVLGYLVMHTRQLDMVMSSPAAVGHYRKRIEDDLRAILGDAPSDVAPAGAE